MKGGFTFNGKDIDSFGLEYVPEMSETYVWNKAQTKIHSQSFDAHDGGYFFGTSTAPKTFKLRCIFEGDYMQNGKMNAILSFFKTGKTGRLTFEKRPWVYYQATVVNCDISQMMSRRSGYITIEAIAYYPFGNTEYNSLDQVEDIYRADVICNSGLLEEADVPSKNLTKSGSITSRKTFLLYNAGNARADAAIAIAGNFPNGVRIINNTNGTSCEFVGVTKSATTNSNKYVLFDSASGKTVLTNGVTAEMSFMYHQQGAILLESAGLVKRDISCISSSDRYTIVANSDVFDEDDAGRYIKFNGTWRKIAQYIDPTTVKLETQVGSANITDTSATVVTFNELVVEPVTSMEITKLEFYYKHTFD